MHPPPPPLPTQEGGASGSGRGWTGARQPTWGSQRPPPRAPECPFSGLSLTTATSRPLSPLGSSVEALVSPLPPQSQGPPRGPAEAPTPKGSVSTLPTFRKRAAAATASFWAPRNRHARLCPPRRWGQTSRGLPGLGRLTPSSSSGGKHYAIQAPFSTHTRFCRPGRVPMAPRQGSVAWGLARSPWQARAWKALWLLVVRPVLLIF